MKMGICSIGPCLMVYLSMLVVLPSALSLVTAPGDLSTAVDVDMLITTTTPPEWVLNTSDAWADYWVKTILKVPTKVEVESSSFRREMETEFAGILNSALQRLTQILAGSFKPLRRRRAITVANATVQMTNISRADLDEPSHTTLVYYLVEEKPTNNLTTADRTVGLMELFSDQEVAIILGYQVVVKAQVYVTPPEPKDKKLWIIGAVIGGLAGLIIIIWCIMFTYFKCTRPPSKLPSPRSPRSAKISDIDQLDYKGKDIKGFDYARTEVGLENELDRQNVPDYYRRYPMGSTDLEGMYSPGETPPPPFRKHRPSSGGSQGKGGVNGEPPPAPPINGFITAMSNGETQTKPTRRKKKKGGDESGSTEIDTDATQDTENSEDKKPLSKKGRRRHKPKKSTGEAGEFENLSKMGRVDDPGALVAPTRTTLHAIRAPSMDDSLNDDSLPEIPSEKDVEDTLRQKADLERYRNKQRQREKKTGQKKRQKHPVGDSKEERRAYHKDQQEIDQVLQNGHTPDKPKRKKKKKPRQTVADPVDNIELQEVPDYRVIQPVLPGMKYQIPQLGHLESDSSDDGLDPMLEGSRGPGSHEKDRELVSALLNEAFAMVTPTPQSNPPIEPVSQRTPPEPQQPPPQLPLDPSSRHTPLYVSAVKGAPGQLPGTWDPYEASDKAANIVPPGRVTPMGSYSSVRSPRQPASGQPSPRSPHQYINPAYMADIPLNINSLPLRHMDVNGTSTPRSGKNIPNGLAPESPSAFTPYQRPDWTESIPRVWDDPDKTLPIGNRFSGKQLTDNDPAQKLKPDENDLSRYHVPKPVRRDSADDEIDIVSDAMKTGSSAQPLIASIREEIERLAKRSQDSNSLRLSST